MSRRRATLVIVIFLAVVVLARIAAARAPNIDVAASLSDPSKFHRAGFVDPTSISELVGQFHDRIEGNPKDVGSYTILGALYVRQARETGDVMAYERAEFALAKALELVPNYTPAQTSLASVLYSQHRFGEAMELAQWAYYGDQDRLEALAIIGDANLAVGNYAEAEAAYDRLLKAGANPPVLARIARVAELKGDTEQALTLMQRAIGEQLRSGLSGERVAWYLTRLADVYFGLGRFADAAEHYRAALRLFDGYYVALAGLGKTQAARGQHDDAISLYEQSVVAVPEPRALAALGDLYARAGNSAKAGLQYDTVELIARLAAINEQVYNRELVLFYADHDLKLDVALELATVELDARKDIYGYDALAWALFKNGRLGEAAEAMSQAMRLGTQEASLFYHSGMIYTALGESDLARRHLSRALELNPGFSIIQADNARRTLAELNGVHAAGDVTP